MAEDAGTATLEAPGTSAATTTDSASPAPVTRASDEDAGTGMVVVPDAPKPPAQPSNKLPGESDKDFRRRMFDEVNGNKPAAVRGADGKFLAKPEGGEGQALQDAADKGAAESKAKADKPAAEPAAETPEQREAWVRARRAFARDQYPQAALDKMDPQEFLAIGGIRADAYDKLDADYAQTKAGGAEPSQTPEEKEAEEAERAQTIANLGLPADVLAYLPEDDQGKLKAHVAAYVQTQTRAAQGEVNKARAELAEFLGEATVSELAKTYPGLKGKVPPREFLDNYYRVRDHYDWLTRDGMKRAMDDAAILTFGRNIKEQVQASMLDRNRASLANQPDPRTLTAPTNGASISTLEFRKKAYEIANQGGTVEKQKAKLDEWRAGRPIVDAKK